MNWSTINRDGMGMDKFDKRNKGVQPTTSKERRGIL
jgi:hypothetical protein